MMLARPIYATALGVAFLGLLLGPTRSKADECQDAQAAVGASYIKTGQRFKSVMEGKLNVNCKIREMEIAELDGAKEMLPLLQGFEKACGHPFTAKCDAACEQERIKRLEAAPAWKCSTN